MANLIDLLDAAIFLLPVAIAAGFVVKFALGFAHHHVAH